MVLLNHLDFIVEENAVEGFGGKHRVSRINGIYRGAIAKGSGTFDLSMFVNFTGYIRDPNSVVPSNLNVVGATRGYGLYATVVASGNFSSTGPDSFVMAFTGGEAHVFLDPFLDTVQTLPPAAGGPVVLSSAGDDVETLVAKRVSKSYSQGIRNGFGGVFQIMFTLVNLSSRGDAYWSDLRRVGLRMLIRASIDHADLSVGSVDLSFLSSR